MKRSVEHIDAVLAAIRETWIECPELRLGQLILNACRYDDLPAVFYADDHILVAALVQFKPRKLVPKDDCCRKNPNP